MKTQILRPIAGVLFGTLLTVVALGQSAAPPALPVVPAAPDAQPGPPPAITTAPDAPGVPAPQGRAGTLLPAATPRVPGVPGEAGPETPGIFHGVPDKLEDIVELAQRTSPEVIIAEAQLREAEARLRQARLEATQQAILAQRNRRIAELARRNVQEVEQKYQAGRGTTQELLAAQERLAELEAALASSNVTLEMMAAQYGGGASPVDPLNAPPRIPAERPVLPQTAENDVQEALNNPVSIEFSDVSVSDIAEFLSEYVGVNIVVDPASDRPVVSVRLSDVPLRDALIALADLGQDVCFVIRDHFIFATTRERAMQISAPTIPENIPLYLPADSVVRETRQEELERQRREAARDAAKAPDR